MPAGGDKSASIPQSILKVLFESLPFVSPSIVRERIPPILRPSFMPLPGDCEEIMSRKRECRV